MMLNLNPADVLAAAQKLETSGELPVSNADTEGNFLTASYSAVSGLSEVGEMHSTILSTNRPESVKAFTDRFLNAATTLRRNVADVVNGDEALAESLDAYKNVVSLGAQLGMAGLPSSPLADIPTGSITNTDTQPLVITPPVVVRPASLLVLAGQFASTNHGIPTSMAGDWTSLASKIRSAADSLDEVLHDLESSAETEAIQLAMGTIRTIQSTGYTFASNADSLAMNNTSLATAGQAQAQQASQVATVYTLAKTTNPALARTIEQSYLTSFPPAMTTTLAPALPSVGQLLPPMSDPNGVSAGSLAADGGAIPSPGGTGGALAEWEDTALPGVVQDAMEHYGMGEAARMRNPQELAAEFQRSGADALDAITAGHVPTTAAAATPAMPPMLQPGAPSGPLASPTATPTAGQFGGLPGTAPAAYTPANTGQRTGTPHTGAPYAGAPHAGATGAGQSTGVHGTSRGVGAPGAAGVGAGASRQGSGATAGGRTSGTGFGGRAVSGSGSGTGVGGRAISGVGGSGSGIGASGSGVGSGARSGVGAGGSAGSSSAAPHVGGGKSPSGVGAGGFGRGSATGGMAGSAAHAAHGGTPVGGMMGAGRGAAGAAGGRRGDNGSSSVHGIKTSAVERKGNLKALLGEGPEVIPGVIGAWVREPRTDR